MGVEIESLCHKLNYVFQFAHTCPFNKRKDIRREEKRSKQHVDDRSGQHTRINTSMIAAASKSVQSKRTEVVRKEVGLVDLVGRVAEEEEVPVRGGEDGGNAAAAVVGGGRDLRHPVVRGSADCDCECEQAGGGGSGVEWGMRSGGGGGGGGSSAFGWVGGRRGGAEPPRQRSRGCRRRRRQLRDRPRAGRPTAPASSLACPRIWEILQRPLVFWLALLSSSSPFYYTAP